MGEILGTIRITDDRIITKKGELVETWSRWSGDDTIFIVYDGIRYKLLTPLNKRFFYYKIFLIFLFLSIDFNSLSLGEILCLDDKNL